MVIRTLIFICLLCSLPATALTRLNASLDKNPVMLGESVTLELTADARVSAESLNFRHLESDFTVMLPSVSQSTSIINGISRQLTTWKVVLLPKKTGNFTIPAFTINGISSSALRLEVVEQSAASAAQPQELFLQSEIEQQELYVQQLTYYQVTIYFSGDLQRGSLSEPKLEGAVIQQLGQDAEGSSLVNGVRYRTITRRYTIIPQRSGNFEIIPPTFTGEILDRDNARYSYYSRTKTVVQQAQPLSINVNAVPDSFPGNWLVAGLVTLNEEWSPSQHDIVQGEPVTRIITLSAVDVAENQLPELQQQFPSGVRLYQEQPQTKSAERNGRLIAQKILTTAVVATDDGTLELPEIRLPWWNSKLNKLEYATLPAYKLEVQPNPAIQSNTPALPAAQTAQQTEGYNTKVSPWAWTHTSTLLAALWLLSVVAFWILWQLRPVTEHSATSDSRARFDSRKLRLACQQNDSKTAKAELLRWGHQQLDKRCTSLSELSALLQPSQLQHELARLNAALYQANAADWQGIALYDSWQNYRHQSKTDNTDQLTPLYRN